MATIFTHPAIALGLSPFFRSALKSKRILVAAIVLTILPDIDVIGFRLGIPYEHVLGHRGLSHSLFFAGIVSGFVTWLLTRPEKTYFIRIWLYLFLCMASHGVLDAFTNGGLGTAFFSPFSNERYFFSFAPIEVSTLNITRFFQGQGLLVIKNELRWIWGPSIAIFIFGVVCLKLLNKGSNRKKENSQSLGAETKS